MKILKKNKKLVITLIIIITIIAACCIVAYNVLNQTDKYKIKVVCNEKEKVYEVTNGTKIKCTLLGDKYTFKFTQISESKAVIKASNFGLSSNNSLLDRNKEWTLYSDETLELNTQTTDYQQYVSFKYEK